MKSKVAYNYLYWHLHCEFSNEDNSKLIRDYYERIWNELIKQAKFKAPKFHQDSESALLLRKRLSKMSALLNECKEKVDEKTGVL